MKIRKSFQDLRDVIKKDTLLIDYQPHLGTSTILYSFKKIHLSIFMLCYVKTINHPYKLTVAVADRLIQ